MGMINFESEADDLGISLTKLRALAASSTAANIPSATTTVAGTVLKAASQATFAGADLTALKVELNAWYAKLQTAGIVT